MAKSSTKKNRVWKKLEAPRYFAWVDLTHKFSVTFFAPMVNRYALTQPQRAHDPQAGIMHEKPIEP